ncbi:hypothetical protein JCM9534A_37500 [Catenuloplanes indicus JCM 9534]
MPSAPMPSAPDGDTDGVRGGDVHAVVSRPAATTAAMLFRTLLGRLTAETVTDFAEGTA